MATGVGQVYYDVLPEPGWAAKFAAQVAAEAGRQKPIKVKVEADTAAAAASMKQATAGSAQFTAASNRLAAAQGRVRVAAAALNETRARAQAGSSRLIAAEERYANAIRGVQNVQQAEAKAAARAVQQREQAAARGVAAAEKAAAREAAVQERAASQSVAARRQAQKSLSTGLIVGGAAAAAAIGGVVKVTADFEQAVSHVAATGDDARANIAALRTEAVKYGADTSFSAREAANAQEALVKANVSVTDTINGGLKGSLDLAAAGSLGVANAAEIMGTAMSQFNLPGTQASHVADLLAAAAGKAQGEVGDFAEALKYVGPLAKSSGVSLEETTGVLAEFANQGILGSQAGTSLRGILQSLTAPSAAASEEMQKYGINVRDASGEFIGLEGVAGQLQARLGGVGKAERDAALARIFGRNSITAATILYEQGAEGVRQWTGAVNDAGFAQDTARTKMDNLKGDLEQLSGAFESAFINTAADTQGGARTIVQAVTGIIDVYNQLPAAGKNTVFIGTGLAAAAAIGVGGVLKIVSVAREAKIALDAMKISARGASLAAGGIGIGITVAAAAIGHFAIQQTEAKQRTDDLTQALLASKGAIDQNIAATRSKALEDSGALKAAQDLGISIADVTQASLGNADAQQRVSAALDQYAGGLDNARNVARGFTSGQEASTKASAAQEIAANKVRDAIGGGNSELERAKEQYARITESQKAAAGSASTLGDNLKTQRAAMASALDAVGALGEKARPTAGDLDKLSTALWGNQTAALAAVDAELAYEEALDQTAKTAKENRGKGVSAKNETGRENARALEAEARASAGLINSYIKQGKSAKFVGDKTNDARKEFIKNATVMTGSADKAKALADKYGLIPKKVQTKVEAQIEADRQAKITKLQEAIKDFPPEVKTKVLAQIQEGDLKGAKATLNEFKKEHLAPVKPVVANDAKAKAKKGLDYFGNPIKTPVEVKTKGVQKAKREVGSVPTRRNTDVNVRSKGVPKTKRDIGSIPKKKDTDVNVKAKGIPKTSKDVKAIKGKSVDVKTKAADIPKTKRDINSVKGKTVMVRVQQSGVGGVQSAINGIHGKTVTITVQKKGGNAYGGTLDTPGFAGGGTIRGNGGPRQDNIAIMDRANGKQMAWGSVGEEMINAKQSSLNRAQLKTINAGGRWDLVPRHADGGTLGPGSVAQARSAAHRTITLNLNLGPVLGGVQRFVFDLMDDRDEYTATVERMG